MNNWRNVKVSKKDYIILYCYCIGPVDAGNCLYAHISIRNKINGTVTLQITSTSSSKNVL